MKFIIFLVILFAGCAMGNVVSNVRLRDHSSYMVNVITATVKKVEQKGWCSLKLPEYVQTLSETVLNKPVKGQVKYTNGFLVSVQQIDIQQSTLQQIWQFNSTSKTPTVSVRGTLRFLSAAIGYDVILELEEESHRYTTVYTHPLLSFAFSVIRNMLTDELEVTVVANVPNTSLKPVYSPRDNVTDILTALFNPTTISAAGIREWGTDVFEPLALNIVTKEIEFPTVCYNCAITA